MATEIKVYHEHYLEIEMPGKIQPQAVLLKAFSEIPPSAEVSDISYKVYQDNTTHITVTYTLEPRERNGMVLKT